MEASQCPGLDSNQHDLKRSPGPQPGASTNFATWAEYVHYACLSPFNRGSPLRQMLYAFLFPVSWEWLFSGLSLSTLTDACFMTG